MAIPPTIDLGIDPTGAHVRLRPFVHEDIPELYATVTASREHIARWLPWAENYQVARAEYFIGLALESYVNEEATHLDLVVEVDGVIAGVCSFVRINWEHREFEVGYWLGLPYTRRGIMTRAVQAMTAHGVTVMGAHRVQIAALAGNAPSRAIPERLGFHSDGVFRLARWHRGGWHDLAWYAMTEAEWYARHAVPCQDVPLK